MGGTQPPADRWMLSHAGERSLYSSALQGSLRCWQSLAQFPPLRSRYSHVSPSSSCSFWAPLAVPGIIFICNCKLKRNGALSFPGPDLGLFNGVGNKTTPRNKFRSASWLPWRSRQPHGKGWGANPLWQCSLLGDLDECSAGTTELLLTWLC